MVDCKYELPIDVQFSNIIFKLLIIVYSIIYDFSKKYSFKTFKYEYIKIQDKRL